MSDQGATPFVPLIQQFQDIPIDHDLVKKIRAMMVRLKCYGNNGSKIFNPFMPSSKGTLANSADPDQTQHLIRVYCLHLLQEFP